MAKLSESKKLERKAKRKGEAHLKELRVLYLSRRLLFFVFIYFIFSLSQRFELLRAKIK